MESYPIFHNPERQDEVQPSSERAVHCLPVAVELGYDAIGNVMTRTVKDSAGTIVYSHTQMFDELGRLLRELARGIWTGAMSGVSA